MKAWTAPKAELVNDRVSHVQKDCSAGPGSVRDAAGEVLLEAVGQLL